MRLIALNQWETQIAERIAPSGTLTRQNWLANPAGCINGAWRWGITTEVEMEEVIEQLRELNEPVPVPLELPDDDLLVEIEEQLLINLPFGLRANSPAGQRCHLWTPRAGHRYRPAVAYLSPEVAANAWDAGVPRDLIPICRDGRDYYVVDLTGRSPCGWRRWRADRGELGIGLALGARCLAES